MVHMQHSTMRFCMGTGFIPATFKAHIQMAHPFTTATLFEYPHLMQNTSMHLLLHHHPMR